MKKESGQAQKLLTTEEYTRAWDRVTLYVDLYKHHFELFIKGFVVFLAVVGTAAGVAFGEHVAPATRQKLLIFIAISSVLALAGWSISFFWIRGFETHFNRACDAAGLGRLPSFGVKAIVCIAAIGSAVLTVLSLAFLASP